jgi:hypothetical protein
MGEATAKDLETGAASMDAVEQYKDDKMEQAARVIRESQLALHRQRYSIPTKIGLYVVALLFLGISLFPIYLILTASLKNDVQIFARPPVFLFTPTFKSYHDVLLVSSLSQVRFIANSLIATVLSTAIAVSSSRAGRTLHSGSSPPAWLRPSRSSCRCSCSSSPSACWTRGGRW